MKGYGQRFSAGFFILFSISLLIFGNNKTVQTGRAGVSDVFVPVIDVLSWPLDRGGDFFEWMQKIAIVFSDNEHLRAENTRLRMDNVNASQLVIDNLRLKNLLNIREGKIITIAASRVVSESGSPFVRSLLLNSGTVDSVQKGFGVVNEEGVVGRIINVGKSSSRVLLITDINSQIPIKVAQSGFNVILAGDNSASPLLKFLPLDMKINVGDLLLTSGMGKVFPPDLEVGRVDEISAEGEIRVRLSANLDRLNYVSIVAYEIAPPPAKQPVVSMQDAK